ncbi:MAG: phosphomannomutase/phosphoglucomutase [Candidatus Nanohaloarchaea archaeon]
MASFFHSYDLRGVYPEEIGEEEAERVGKAYGTFTDAEKVLVGRDGRKHAEKIASAFIDGIMSTGTDVIDAGRVPTPVVYFGMVDRGIKSSAVVTASHNPPEYTGFKFTKEGALAMSREGGMAEIEEIYESGEFDTGSGSLEAVEIEQDYIDFVLDKISLEKELDVAVNFGNGVAAEIGGEMLEALGCDVNAVNQEIDGSFPNHLPAPGEEEAQRQLRDAMDNEDLGIIFDGDGDRAGFLLPSGEYIAEDEVLAIFSEEVLGIKRGKVLHDLRASKLVPEKIREHSGKPVETRVGHTFISEEIHSDPEIVFAGELSGHYYFPAFEVPWDDGLFAAALMCRIASEMDLEEKVESMPDYPVSPELRIDCPENAKEKVVEGVAEKYSDHEISTKDGVKVQFEDGWALVRPSSTEPKMSVRCEADSEEALDRILEDVRSTVDTLIEEFSA